MIKRISSTRKAVVGHGRIRPRASCFVGKSIISKIFPESRAAKDLKNEWFEDALVSREGFLPKAIGCDQTRIRLHRSMRPKAGDLIRISAAPESRRREIVRVVAKDGWDVRVSRGGGHLKAKSFKRGADLFVIGNLP